MTGIGAPQQQGPSTHSLGGDKETVAPGLQDVPGERLLPSFPSRPTEFSVTACPNFLGSHPPSVILGGKLGDRGI